ncbi:MAG TPA: caspase family protein, partial [Devosia sp.]|nr:caspase family protein [Devosia sp.]
MARRGLATSGFALGKTVQVLLLAAIAVGLMASGAWASGRVALVVGNGSYATLGTLANPTNDAEDIAATLRGMGFQVTVADNADERGFTELLSNFATAATDADVALFYYSGHGLQYRSENYLVPVDATLENRFSLTH